MLSVCDWEELGRVSICHDDAHCIVPEWVNHTKWQDYICICKDGFVDMTGDGSICLAAVKSYFERTSFLSTSSSLQGKDVHTCDSFTLSGVETPYTDMNGVYIVSFAMPNISSHPHYQNIEDANDTAKPRHHLYYTEGKWILDDDTDPSTHISSHVDSTRFVTTPCELANLTDQLLCEVISRGQCEFTQDIVQQVEMAVKSPHTIQFDADQYGEIFDGGGGLYDGGNRIFTSLCPYSQLQPYSDNFQMATSTCFGNGGSYRMNKGISTLMLATKNYHNADIDIYIKGNLGSDDVGLSFSWEIQL